MFVDSMKKLEQKSKRLPLYSMVLYCTFFTRKYRKILYPVMVPRAATTSVVPTAIDAVSSLNPSLALQSKAGPKSVPLYMKGCSWKVLRKIFPWILKGLRLSSGKDRSIIDSPHVNELPTGVGNSIFLWDSLMDFPESRLCQFAYIKMSWYYSRPWEWGRI